MKKSGLINLLMVLFIEILVYLYSMIFLRIESIWIIIITIALIGGILYLSRKFKKQFDFISESFKKNSNFAILVMVILLFLFPFVSKLLVPLYIYWLLIVIQTSFLQLSHLD